MGMEQEALIYLYGIVPADVPAPPSTLLGVEGSAPRLVQLARIAAVVSEVPAELYADDALNPHLEDLTWVGERGLAHERVLDWFAERGAIIPSSLFSLHLDEERLRGRLEEDESRLAEQLEGLRDKREWGVKLWRRDAVLAENIVQLSPALQALAAELEGAAPGRKFLLGKKLDALRSDELKRLSARVVHTVFNSLTEQADRASHMPVPPAPARVERALALDAAFLVASDGFKDFQRRLGEMAGEFQPYGFEFEFTGPWPPYHFAQPDAS